MVTGCGEGGRRGPEPESLRELGELLREQNGQLLYNAVSATKRALSTEEQAALTFRQKGLVIEETVTRADFESWIAPDIEQLGEGIDQAVVQAGLSADKIDRVFLTGGTSFVPAVRALFTSRFGEEKVEKGGEFVSVAEGLALADPMPLAA